MYNVHAGLIIQIKIRKNPKTLQVDVGPDTISISVVYTAKVYNKLTFDAAVTSLENTHS